MEDVLFNIGIILIVTSFLGVLCKLTRQSLILAYIGTGILLGPVGHSLINLMGFDFSFFVDADNQILETLSVFGIILLLFLVGIDFNLKSLHGLKSSIFFICFGQIIATFSLAFLGINFFFPNYQLGTVALLSVSLIFSSTIIVVKMLADQKDLGSLYGKISLGMLLSQDLVAIFTLIILSNISLGQEISTTTFSLIILKFFGLILFTYGFSNLVLRKIFHFVAHSQELLFLTAIANCFLFAIIAHYLNISIEIGAFLGGVSIAMLPYRKHIESKIKPLRDFFLILFFVTLGLQFEVNDIGNYLPLILFVTIFTLFVKPTIIFFSVLLTGFKKRTAFLSSMYLSQLSEFSLILLGSVYAIKLDLISPELLSAITLVTIITIIISNYLGNNLHKIYFKIHNHIRVRERSQIKDHLHNIEEKPHGHIILCGYEGMGEDILVTIQKTKLPYLIVDINPQVIQDLIKKKVPCIFGDITDPDILETINIAEAKIVISTITLFDDNAFLLKHIENKDDVILLVEGEDAQKALKLYELGADYVIITEFLGGSHASLVLDDMYQKNFRNLKRLRKKHLEFLEDKKEHSFHHA